MSTRTLARLHAAVLCLCLAFPLHAALRPAAEAGTAAAPLRVFGAPDLTPAERGQDIYERLDSSLIEIWQQAQKQPAADLLGFNPAVRLRSNPPLAVPEVLVDVTAAGDPQALRAELEGLGLKNASVFANDVGGWLPVDQIANAGALGAVNGIRAAHLRTRAGAVTSQGDFAQGSDLARTDPAVPNLSGAGITVGVLSDSFNCFQQYRQRGLASSSYAPNGFSADYPDDVASGDLPSGVRVLKEGDCLNYAPPDPPPFTDEGRAMLQIVHDVAPGAALAFHTAFASEADFANGIIALANAGARVIVDDVGYADEPVFQDGILAQAVDRVQARGVAYFSSAGNDARNSYENPAPKFPVTAASGPNAGERLLNFDSSGATTATVLPVKLPALAPGESIGFVVEWDQPYVTGAPGSKGASSALDLCYADTRGNVQQCSGRNRIGRDPVLLLSIGNPITAKGSTAAQTIGIVIGLATGAPPGLVKLIVQDDGAGASIQSFATSSPTIQGHPGAAGAAAVGAAFFFDTPRCSGSAAILETFSSGGGDPILFDTGGHRLAAREVRQKPDFVAPDGGNDTFLGFTLASAGIDGGLLNTDIAQCQNNPSYPNFFGTSAAAPHAGAVAALLLQAHPAANPTEIVSVLQQTASVMGSGVNFDNGHGFIQANYALALLTNTQPVGSSSSGGGGSSSGGGSGSSSGFSASGGGGGGGASYGPGVSSGAGAFGVLGLLLLGLPALVRLSRR
ncbi:MAG: S8 family serine peptidase [Nevskia sp.]|nr:S8 family serine peptidase [Nevskia sp.]